MQCNQPQSEREVCDDRATNREKMKVCNHCNGPSRKSERKVGILLSNKGGKSMQLVKPQIERKVKYAIAAKVR